MARRLFLCGLGSIAALVVTLFLSGLVLVFLHERDNLWWRYVVLCLFLAPVPAALTVDRHNAARTANRGDGIDLSGTTTDGNLIEGNLIGTEGRGNRPLIAFIALSVAATMITASIFSRVGFLVSALTRLVHVLGREAFPGRLATR